MARRKSSSPSLSLFAFQDIITGVAGVMLFILMLLVVQLAIQVTQAVAKSDSQQELETTASAPAVTLLDIQQAKELIARKQEQYAKNKAKIDLLLNLDAQGIDEAIKKVREQLAQRQKELLEEKNLYQQLYNENQTAIANNPAQEVLQEIESLEKQLQDLEQESLEWKDSTRVNYQTTNTVEHLYIFDVHRTHVAMSKLPSDDRERQMPINPNDTHEEVAEIIENAYRKLPAGERDSMKRIVVLIRPSAAKFGEMIGVNLKQAGFEVALELLEAKAELFKKRKPREPLSGEPEDTP